MRLVSKTFIRKRAEEYPKAAKYLEQWIHTAEEAEWRSLVDVRRHYPTTDSVRVNSGRNVLVFNVCGNDYRFICAAHFNTQVIFALCFMTHAEYSKNSWKNEL
ncbi:MAG TPA: type II toxin-antitoxin system HigB family toxin [Verrucomicrobiae bacterium]|jgi:mRNA interferase HigB|nr:type II toxin-antitoxin system HigB family toxin [Verrucomicrobiae bacterium]